MTKNTVARRYAQALFNLVQSSELERVKQALLGLSRGLDDSTSLKHVVASPVFTFEEKQSVLVALSEKTQSPSVLKDFLGQVLKKNRMRLLPEIAEAFHQLTDQYQGKHQIGIRSAQLLDENEQNRLRTELGALMKRDVEIVFQTEPSLVSGLQVSVGSKVYDSTMRTRLSKIRALLVKG